MTSYPDKIGEWFYDRRPQSYLWALLVVALIVAGVVVGTHSATTTLRTSSTTTPATTTSLTTSTVISTTTNPPGSVTITGAQARNHIGQFETVKFNVAYTYTDSSGTEFLDQYVHYQNGFVVTIYASALGSFSFDPASACLYQTIKVSGYVSTYANFVEILNPVAIQIFK